MRKSRCKLTRNLISGIREIGEAPALDAAIDRLPGARLNVVDLEGNGCFDLRLQTPGLLRALNARELSDGTLRYLALVAALLSPRPAPLLAFNERKQACILICCPRSPSCLSPPRNTVRFGTSRTRPHSRW